MQTTEQQIITSMAREDHTRVKSFLERMGAPFYDSEKKTRVNSTPVIEITDKVSDYFGSSIDGNKFYLKLEYKNPLTESVKGRAVASMVLKAIESHAIYSKSGVRKRWIEPTSGNTGKGLAEIANLLGVEFTAVFSRLDVAEEIKSYLARYGAKVITIGSEYSLGDLESLADKRGKEVVYYWSNFGGPNDETQNLVSGRVSEERSKYNEKSSSKVLKELDGGLLLDTLLPLALEASNTPIVARAQKGEFNKLKQDLLKVIPELSDGAKIVAFVCPIGNTSMVISTLLNQLGFTNVCSIQGGSKSMRTEEGINLASSEFCPVPGASITKSSIEFVKKLVQDDGEEYFTFMQYDNVENVYAHMMTTAPEIEEQVKQLDYVVCTFGTGGTATGIARYFGERKRVIVAFPDRPVEGIRTLGGVEGLSFYKPELYAQTIKTDSSQLESVLVHFAKEGLGFGPSTGIALLAAIGAAKESSGKSFVVIAADGIGNYESEYKNIL
jgi:cysteine synthase